MSAPPPTSTAQPLAAAVPVQGTTPAVSELQEKVELATAEAKASLQRRPSRSSEISVDEDGDDAAGIENSTHWSSNGGL